MDTALWEGKSHVYTTFMEKRRLTSISACILFWRYGVRLCVMSAVQLLLELEETGVSTKRLRQIIHAQLR
jgi:hypothetical protein